MRRRGVLVYPRAALEVDARDKTGSQHRHDRVALAVMVDLGPTGRVVVVVDEHGDRRSDIEPRASGLETRTERHRVDAHGPWLVHEARLADECCASSRGFASL